MATATTLVSVPADASDSPAGDSLRPYAPNDAPTLALALGRAIVREMNALQTVAPSDDDPFAGIATGRTDTAARYRKLDSARASLASVHSSYTVRMEQHLRAIVALQEDLRASLAESCHVIGVSLPSVAETLGIKVAGDATIAELSADAKARANIARQLEDARLEAKREIEETRIAREMRLDELHAEKMRLDGYSEIEVSLAMKQRAEKRDAKIAAKQAKRAK